MSGSNGHSLAAMAIRHLPQLVPASHPCTEHADPGGGGDGEGGGGEEAVVLEQLHVPDDESTVQPGYWLTQVVQSARHPIRAQLLPTHVYPALTYPTQEEK